MKRIVKLIPLLSIIYALTAISTAAYGQCTVYYTYNETCWNPKEICVIAQGYSLIDVKKDHTYEFTTCMDIVYKGYTIFRGYDSQGDRIDIVPNQFPTEIILEEDLTGIPILTEHKGPICNGNYNATRVSWTATFTGKIRVKVGEYPNKVPQSSQGSDCVAAFAYRISKFPNYVKPNLASLGQYDPERKHPKLVSAPYYGDIDIGQSGKVQFSILNTGYDVATQTPVGIYVSKDGVLDTSDTLVQTVVIPPLKTGYVHDTTATFLVDANILSYATIYNHIHIIINADELGSIAESDENDNSWAKASVVVLHTPSTIGNPDYVATISADHLNYYNPKDMILRMNVENKGTGDVEGMKTNYHVYFSYDPILSADDYLLTYEGFYSLGTYKFPPLKINQSESFYLELWDWTNFANPGQKGYFILSADHVNRIAESNEQNNIAVLPMTFPYLYWVDLIPFLPYNPPSTGFINVPFSYEANILNSSAVEVPYPTLTKLYFSSNEFLDEEDYFIAETVLDPLEPGGEIPLLIEGMISDEVEIGQGFLILELDAQNELEEGNEENNILVTEFHLDPYPEEWRKSSNANNKVNQADVNIFPNPSNGDFSIKLNGYTRDLFSQLDVYNVMGELIYSRKIETANEYSLNLQAFPAGIYFVKIKGEQETISKKLVLQSQ